MAVSGGKRLRLGEILINAGVLSDEQLTIGLNNQKQTREPIGEILMKLGFVTDAQIRHALELQYGIKAISLKSKIPPEILRILPEAVIRQYQILPVGINQLTLAMVDPTNFLALDDIRMRLKGVNIQPVVVTEAEFSDYVRQMPKQAEAARGGAYAREETREEELLRNLPVSSAISIPQSSTLTGTDELNPTQLASTILSKALSRQATEIIIEPRENETLIRYRIDGGLLREDPMPAKIAQGLLARFKVLADLNQTAGQIPQSGVFSYSFEGRLAKVFINTVPVNFGQMMTLRLYDSRHLVEGSMDSIVLQPKVLESLKALIKKKSGLILFNGPVGSWKTTLMYACLKELAKSDRTLVTVATRAAYDVPGVCQALVSDDLPATAVLDAVVKQRPDVVMIPNITDPAVANQVIQLALSGCLVLAGASTTQGVLSEAADRWNVPLRTFANALTGIVTQRVVRKLCKCKALDTEGAVYHPAGCPDCNNTAYQGQVGVFEVIACNPQVKDLISRGIPRSKLSLFIRKMRMLSFFDYASWLVTKGYTGLEELGEVAEMEEVFEDKKSSNGPPES